MLNIQHSGKNGTFIKFELSLILLLFPILLASCSSILPKRQSSDKAIGLLEQGTDIKVIVDALAVPLIKSKSSVGMVIGVVTPQGQKVFSYGVADKSKKSKLNENSLFQIGSITKLFTASTISILENKKLLRFDEKVSKYFKDDYISKNESINNITLDQVLTHSSGLDRENYSLGMGLSAIRFLFTGDNLWSQFEKIDMFDYFSKVEIAQSSINKYSYSNTGYILLGEVIERIEKNKTYSDQVKDNLLIPLGLNDTRFILNEDQKMRLATGYVGEAPPFMFSGIKMKPWYIAEGLWSAGSLYSSMKDLLKMLKVNMGIESFEYYKIFKEGQVPKYETDDGYIGRAWFIKELPNLKDPYISVRGYFAGYNSFMGFDKKKKVGVIVLQNTLNLDDYVGVPLMERILKYLNKSSDNELVGLDYHKNSKNKIAGNILSY